jgi:hypothetical protein
MPAIAYTSGKYSLPSAARVEAVRPSRVLLGFRGSAGGCASDPLKIARDGAIGQPLSAGLWIGTHCHGAQAVEGTARERTR